MYPCLQSVKMDGADVWWSSGEDSQLAESCRHDDNYNPIILGVNFMGASVL